MKTLTIGFMGAGNMAYALASAIAQGFPQHKQMAADISAERIQLFQKALPSFEAAESNTQLGNLADILFLAVKPQVLGQVLPEIQDYTGIAVSIAAGIPLKALEKALPQAQVVRVMPNTPCLVGEMAAGCAFSANFPEDKKATVISLLETAGLVEVLPEDQIDAVTALSGSGPAFMARLFDYFIQAGEELGLSRETARRLCLQTARGTARLLEEKQLSPQALIDQVSSPGGTTIAGREVLENSEAGKIIQETLKAAFNRSKELGS